MGKNRILFGAVAVAAALSGGALVLADIRGHDAKATETATTAAPSAIPVSVAIVESREVVPWEEFSGRLEAVEKVEVRSRVSGQVQAVHFREGGLVKKGDLLVTIDPAPFAAEVDRAEAQVASAQARLGFTKREYDRAQALTASGNMPVREADNRANAYFEAQANLRATQAALETARLNLSYTRVAAPVSGRVGKAEVTVGNLVPAGAGAPVLTTLVSVSPIYASFDASEQVVMRSIAGVRDPANGGLQVERIPVQMVAQSHGDTPVDGRVHMIGNAVDAKSGTVEVRAVFDNADGSLMPGQFARLRMGQPKTESVLLISERAVGTDQDKKYVMVVGDDNKAAYRTVVLGAVVDGMRVVNAGLKPGERIIVGGLQRVRPGSPVAPQQAAMPGKGAELAQR